MANRRIGVLLCDHVAADLQAISGGDYDLVYRRMLLAAEPDLEVAVYPAVNGVLPESTNECDGWIITGSHLSAFSDEPWVVALREWLADAAKADARLDRMDADTVASARARLSTEPTDGPIVGQWLVDFLLDRRRDN